MVDNVIKKIEEGPIVLFLGQNYLSRESGIDTFLARTLEKYNAESATSDLGYDSLLKLGLNKNADSALSWMSNLCRNISAPAWLEIIAKLPLSAVYTSSFDTIFERVFTNEWRTVQPITDENFRVTSPRSQTNLHITYLLGSILETESNKRPPLSNIEKAKRKFTYTALLNRLPEIVTPRGILIIDGYDLKDQISIGDLFPILSQFSEQQVLLCGASPALQATEYISDLAESGKLLVFEDSFAKKLVDWQSTGQILIKGPENSDPYGKWLTIYDRKIKIPQELFMRLSKTASILDDKIFYPKPSNNLDEKYEEFKKFLSSTNSSPFWAGYPQNFAFKRDYYFELKNEIVSRLKNSDKKEIPIILYGQASSGKTTSLGLLAYELRDEVRCPVLFIEKRYQRTDETDIDYFCKWAEDNDAKNTIVIWDGMLDPDIYHNILRKLNTRGRNVILVGSCYAYSRTKKGLENYFSAPIDLSPEEKIRFTSFINTIDPFISTILSKIADGNLLAMLYRYLPSSRRTIKQGLKSEYDFFVGYLTESQKGTIAEDKGHLYEGLKLAGVIDDQALVELKTETQIDNDTITLADQLIFSIMVPGKYGLNVPFELLLRTIGYETFSSSLFRALNDVKIIEWIPGYDGEYLLGPRTAIEAQILTTYLGSKDAEAEYILLLLANISAADFATFGGEADSQVQFAVDLLNKVGPNSTQDFTNYLYKFAEALRSLREGGYAYHPRLILKEANFLREVLRYPNIDIPESPYEVLDRAEEIVREALAQLEEYQERTITTFLKVELAAILGTKIKNYIKDGHNAKAKETYELLREPFNSKFASNPENYSALDVLAWTTEDLIRNDIFSIEEKLDAETELLNYFELAETEGVSDQYLEDFNRRRLQLFETVGKEDLADKTFSLLKEMGYASGYYFRAKKILGLQSNLHKNILEEKVVKSSQATWQYLSDNYSDIKNDGKCVYLLLTCWWVSKTGRSFFSDERQLLAFSAADWQYCLDQIYILLSLDSIYQSATIYYLKGIAEFHLGHYKDSINTFRILDSETNYTVYGRRRINKFYLASNTDGTPKVFSGQVRRAVSSAKYNRKGEISVNEMREFVPFLLNDFNKNIFQEGERISKFYIGFNFRGPIALPYKN